jgi:hypothetical protein
MPPRETCSRSADFRRSSDSIEGFSLSVSTRSQIESPIVERSSDSGSWPRSIESCRKPGGDELLAKGEAVQQRRHLRDMFDEQPPVGGPAVRAVGVYGQREGSVEQG